MGVKKYFSNQFKTRRLCLEHESPSNFYLSSLQIGRSIWPLLILRSIVFLTCIAILLWSIILTSRFIGFKYWLLYLTHWGLVMNTICSGFAWQVSLAAYLHGPIPLVSTEIFHEDVDILGQVPGEHGDFGLPWYVKAFWVSYNIAVPVAVFITIFYWAFLTTTDVEFAIDPVLDVFIHAMNTVLMLCLVLTSRHPSHILHFYQPLVVTVIYLIFSIVYYFAGGTNYEGEAWIYPNIDWSDPGPTSVMVVASAFLLLFSYLIVMGLSLGRDYIIRRCIDRSATITIQS